MALPSLKFSCLFLHKTMHLSLWESPSGYVSNFFSKLQNINIMTDNEYIKTRKATADARINWAKTGIRQFAMREVVNDYLEVSGANRSSISGEEAILAHRKIAANRLAIDCIYVLSKEELSKVDRELEWIASDFLMQDLGIRK